jgi:L-lactate dehydrogenase
MKVTLVGNGRVGSAIGFAIVLQRLADELVIVDRVPEAAIGDAADLAHASALSQPMTVRAGGVEAAVGSDVVIITASVPAPRPPASRLQLAESNARLFAELIPKLVSVCPEAVYLVVSNPVDVMTYLALRYSRGVLPPARVIGAGTLIDTARYRTLLAEYVGIHTNDIRAYIMGEHGDSQFPALSAASAGGQRLDSSDPTIALLGERARGEGDRVFAAKGYTNFAIAAATASLLSAIATHARSVFPVSTLLTDYHGVSDVCLSVPAVIGRSGILQVLKVDLSEEEIKKLHHSARIVRSAIDALPAH